MGLMWFLSNFCPVVYYSYSHITQHVYSRMLWFGCLYLCRAPIKSTMLSVHLSVCMQQLETCWTCFHDLVLGSIPVFVEPCKFSLRQDSFSNHFLWKLTCVFYASWVKVAECLVGWKIFAMKVLDESETHNLCQVLFFCASLIELGIIIQWDIVCPF